VPPPFAPNAFIRIDRQGAVTLVMPMVEMGQGIYTAMAMLLAEELEVGLDQVRPGARSARRRALCQFASPHPDDRPLRVDSRILDAHCARPARSAACC